MLDRFLCGHFPFHQLINSRYVIIHRTASIQLIGDILDLSKIESGTLKFVWSDVNINAMIYDLEKVFQLRNKNNPEVEIRFVPGMEECVIRTERLMGGGSVLNSSREKVPLFGLQFLKSPSFTLLKEEK